jgi:hypothetical protein
VNYYIVGRSVILWNPKTCTNANAGSDGQKIPKTMLVLGAGPTSVVLQPITSPSLKMNVKIENDQCRRISQPSDGIWGKTKRWDQYSSDM